MNDFAREIIHRIIIELLPQEAHRTFSCQEQSHLDARDSGNRRRAAVGLVFRYEYAA